MGARISTVLATHSLTHLAAAAALQPAAEVERLQDGALHGGHHAARTAPRLHQAEPGLAFSSVATVVSMYHLVKSRRDEVILIKVVVKTNSLHHFSSLISHP